LYILVELGCSRNSILDVARILGPIRSFVFRYSKPEEENEDGNTIIIKQRFIPITRFGVGQSLQNFSKVFIRLAQIMSFLKR
jgi:hypothetical protein